MNKEEDQRQAQQQETRHLSLAEQRLLDAAWRLGAPLKSVIPLKTKENTK